jgi:hypothetical protein
MHSGKLYSLIKRQRSSAAADEKALITGGWLGALLTFVVVFTFGILAFLAAWAGMNTDSNTAFFSILTSANGDQGWILIIVTLIAITMNESAVDSLQNAISSTVASLVLSLGFSMSLTLTRIIVVLLNIPIMLIGLQGYQITSLFLISNMITTFSMPPLILGLFECFDGVLTGNTVLFSNIFSFFAILIYGYIRTVNS